MNAGRPAIVAGPKGPVIAWTDAHEGNEHAYAVVLDDAMRDAVRPSYDVTPEAGAVSAASTCAARWTRSSSQVAYWDAKGTDAGVHARFLEADGRIAGPSVAVAQVKGPNANPSVARAADGSLFIAWTDELDKDSEDLFIRRLNPKLEPQGDAVRLTDLEQNSVAKPRVRSPIVAVEANALHVAFRLERDPSHLVELLRLPLADASKGVEPLKKGAVARADRNVGDMALVNSDKGKADAPSLACGSGACFVVWHGEAGGGASAAYVDPVEGAAALAQEVQQAGHAPVRRRRGRRLRRDRLVRRRQGARGEHQPRRRRPADEDRARERASSSDAFDRRRRPKAGEWYVAWQDYEAGHLEAYAARILCKARLPRRMDPIVLRG